MDDETKKLLAVRDAEISNWMERTTTTVEAACEQMSTQVLASLIPRLEAAEARLERAESTLIQVDDWYWALYRLALCSAYRELRPFDGFDATNEERRKLAEHAVEHLSGVAIAASPGVASMLLSRRDEFIEYLCAQPRPVLS